jgi:hypothetical protein
MENAVTTNPVTSDAEASGVPYERAHFKELLLLDHFKLQELKGSEGPPIGNETYEQLVCIGYRPSTGRLDAVVQINQSSGYDGGLCTPGSQEYVRFFASTDGGATWTDLGLTSFTVWDIPGAKPLDFDVSIPVDLAAKCCQDENLVLIRGILSWEVPPAGPDSPIVWGNGLDVTVQVAPIALGTIEDLLECLELTIEPSELAAVVDPSQLVEFAAPEALSPTELHRIYQPTGVPQHRYLLSALQHLLDDPVALSAAVAGPGFELFPSLEGVDLGSLVKFVIDPQGDETYEQLGCVALNPTTDELVATLELKQPAGYSGGLCTAGSEEYVAFWVDWGGGFQYVGTSAVNVHDLSDIPASGLEYSASVAFPQALTMCQPCNDGPLTVTLRAVLSWNSPPSDTDPFAVPVWGGHVEATTMIPPGEPVAGGGPVLESIGSMPVALISSLTGLASGTSLVPAIGVANACPFGGALEFTGHVINPSTGLFGGAGFQYRILVSTNGGLTSTPMTDPFDVILSTSPTPVHQTPDPTTGWTNYLELSGSVDVVGNILGSWTTSGNGRIWISMEARQGVTPIGTATTWTLVQLDNTAPSPVEIAITTGAGSCGDFAPGDTIGGTYSAQDNENLRGVSISVEAAMPGSVLTQLVGTKTLTSESGTWSLATLATTEPCGYVMIATASDNTIVNSGFVGFESQAFQGFCLRFPVAI